MHVEPKLFQIGQKMFVVERKEVRVAYFSHQHQGTFHICPDADSIGCRPIAPQQCFATEIAATRWLISILEKSIAQDYQTLTDTRRALENLEGALQDSNTC